MAVFKINRNFDAVLNPEAAKLIPELKGMSKDQLLYIILVIDYVDSPFRKKPIEERRILARRLAFPKAKLNPETEKVQLGMNAYKSLIFDIRRETIDIYKSKIVKLQKETISPDVSFVRMKEIDSTITFMQDRLTSIEHELDIEEGENLELKGQKKLSYLEIWQRKQKEYHEYKNSF